MLKRLVLAVVFVTCLCGRLYAFEQQKGGSNAAQSKPSQPQQPVPPTHVVIDPPLPVSDSQPPTPIKPEAFAEKSLPRFERPEWVIVYITALYAFIAWLTFKPIKRQADLMDTQAKDARKSAADAAITAQNTLDAIRRQADLLKEQSDLMISKERARLTLEPQNITEFQMDIPWDTIDVNIRNYGYTHALNVRLETWCEISDSEDRPNSEKRDSSGVSIVLANTESAKVTLPISSTIWSSLVPLAKNLHIHLWGTCNYEDVFGGTHLIQFGYIFKIWRLGKVFSRDGLDLLPVASLRGWTNCPVPKDGFDSNDQSPS
ncbi:hypothetical protein [Granulicella mallensis]|uniref:Uncharacterized protein n=1 Tax=Granulicella mallensis TaxID=940614 RepID=A0A7W8ED65_9BACT|nr:hypothetical protein [Granulicella mallensis]MBB5066395.1 hypothetical protein [Granulicella mallensis]